MTNIKCPCEECVCIAICRHKEYMQMVLDCDYLLSSLYRRRASVENRTERFTEIVTGVEKNLRPSMWKVKIDDDGSVFIEGKDRGDPWKI